jgi:predicted GNAT superfamily acetyltransferase
MVLNSKGIEIRECTSLEDLCACVELQRQVFALPEIEISPVRHFIVTRNAGGFTLGAFSNGELVGFVLSVPAYLRSERAFYSHMTAVRADHQGSGIGARLKWAQRDRSLSEGVKFLKWTFEPVKARNAYFNLEKLGAIVREMRENFYGTDYSTAPELGEKIGLASDRLFAEWELESPKVRALAKGRQITESRDRAATIFIMDDWLQLVKTDSEKALAEQIRIRGEFNEAFSKGYVVRGFRKAFDKVPPAFLLYED